MRRFVMMLYKFIMVTSFYATGWEASYDILGDWISSVPLLASGIHGLWNIIIAYEVNANSNVDKEKKRHCGCFSGEIHVDILWHEQSWLVDEARRLFLI